jgi:hypothetical protein
MLSAVLSVMAAGTAIVSATPAQAGTLPADCEVVVIKSMANHLYVSAEIGSGYTGGNYGMLRARATTWGLWEEFQKCVVKDGSSIFKSMANHLYVSAEIGSGYTGGNYGMLRARATTWGLWEEFMLESGGPYIYSYETRLAVSAEIGSSYTGGIHGMLRARTHGPESLGPWEKFQVIPVQSL